MARFIDGGEGKILVTVHEPSDTANHAVIVLPAFAEEMNKSRRLVWNTGRQLAEHGYLVIVPDLFGTGDSEGDFAEASWNTWVLDLRHTVDWAKAHGVTRISALAVRFGACLLSSVLKFVDLEHVVAWQPPASGSEVLRGLVRTKALNMRMAGQKAPSSSELLDRLYNGEQPMELSGYAIGSRLATAVRDATFSQATLPVRGRSLVVLFQKNRDGSPAERQATQGPGDDRLKAFIGGERFWLAMEPGPNNELVTTTAQFFDNR